MVVCIVVTGSCRPARRVHIYETESGEFGVRRELFMFRNSYDIQLLAVHVHTCMSASNQYILSQL